MKLFKTLLTILVISLLSSPSWSMDIGELMKREGIYYQKFSDVPYTGKITGGTQGSIKNGKREGAWVFYYESGQLEAKGNFKNGEREGAWVDYHQNGQLWGRHNYTNGNRYGAQVSYNEDGTLNKLNTGTFKKGEKIRD